MSWEWFFEKSRKTYGRREDMVIVSDRVNPTNHILFEVLNGDRKNVVDLSVKSCTCKRFQMDQISCAHAIAVFQKLHPPKGRIRVGRPKKRRCKASWERNAKTLKSIICGKCKKKGHKRRTCRNPTKND
ncbi:hypothetical protein POM88_012750 [Heracleum sosnowskyi]|uniref:SWIM-type domain-containing protein n=1 Tax=Heracleum sosnowskyi TaxID=360622 RepID=A0AAD8N221_9APIA|nr:hypothetical protein POM88_012750 [Heracleum sosnowskyi]